MDSAGGPSAKIGNDASPSADRRAHRTVRPARRWLVALAWVLGTLGAFAVYLRLSRTRAVNSDGASIALQAWDMLHGNPLLRGWRLNDVTFYTTEVPQYALVEMARGLGQDVVHVAAAMTYTLVVLFAALLAKGTATGREAAVRVALAVGILLAPQPVSGVNVLLSSPDHTGTAVPVMAVWLILDRARPRWYIPVATSLLLAWAQAGDVLVAIIGVVPLVLVSAVRLLRRPRPPAADHPASKSGPGPSGPAGPRWYDIALGAGAVAAVGVGSAVPRLIHAAGGYAGRPLSTGFAPLSKVIGHNLAITGQSLLLLPGADFLGLRPGTGTFFVVLHLAGVALAACGIAVGARRFAGDDRVNQMLLVAIAANLASFVTGTHVLNLPSAREIAPVLPFAAALAGRQLARPLLSARLASLTPLPQMLFGLVLAGYLAGLWVSAAAPQQPAQALQLTTWLEHHHLGTGLSGYWEGNVVALTSGNRSAVRLVGDDCACGLITIGTIEVKASWFDPARSSADFVVLFPGIDGFPGFTGREQALATFGKPARTYHVGRYTILYWHKNLLPDLHPLQLSSPRRPRLSSPRRPRLSSPRRPRLSSPRRPRSVPNHNTRTMCPVATTASQHRPQRGPVGGSAATSTPPVPLRILPVWAFQTFCPPKWSPGMRSRKGIHPEGVSRDSLALGDIAICAWSMDGCPARGDHPARVAAPPVRARRPGPPAPPVPVRTLHHEDFVPL